MEGVKHSLASPRGVRFEGCYSPGSVMATHKGVELTSWGCWQAALGC